MELFGSLTVAGWIALICLVLVIGSLIYVALIAPLYANMAEQLRQRHSRRQSRGFKESEILRLQSLPYADYLKTYHWWQIREDALERAKRRCQACSNADGLEVHHNSYERRGQEEANDVIVLCRECHRRIHEGRGTIGESTNT